MSSGKHCLHIQDEIKTTINRKGKLCSFMLFLTNLGEGLSAI